MCNREQVTLNQIKNCIKVVEEYLNGNATQEQMSAESVVRSAETARSAAGSAWSAASRSA